MTRGHNGAAPPFMWGSFIPYSMPVYPGVFGVTPLFSPGAPVRPGGRDLAQERLNLCSGRLSGYGAPYLIPHAPDVIPGGVAGLYNCQVSLWFNAVGIFGRRTSPNRVGRLYREGIGSPKIGQPRYGYRAGCARSRLTAGDRCHRVAGDRASAV